MKKIVSLLVVLAMLIAMVPAVFAASTNAADLNTLPNTSSSYGTNTTTNGWIAANAQVVPNEYSAESMKTALGDYYGVILNGKTSAVGTLTSPTLKNGIKSLSFNYAHFYSESKGINIDIVIKNTDGESLASKNVVIANSEVVQNTAYSYVWTLDSTIEGDFVIYIENNSPSNNGSKNKDRLAIWNLTWTSASEEECTHANGTVDKLNATEHWTICPDCFAEQAAREAHTYTDGVCTTCGHVASVGYVTSVDDVDVNKTYKLHLYTNVEAHNWGTNYYATGALDGDYLATTTDITAAADLHVEEADGGYYLYFLSGETKSYISLQSYKKYDDSTSDSYKIVLVDSSADASVMTWLADACTFATTVTGTLSKDAECYMGTYKNYNTFSVSKTSFITGENAGAVDVSSFPARLVDVTPAEETVYTVVEETTFTAEDNAAAFTGATHTFIPEADGEVTVSVSSANPGYMVEVYANGEWVEDLIGTTEGAHVISVISGVEYSLIVRSYQYYEAIGFGEAYAGSVTYEVTSNVPVTLVSDGSDDSDDEGGESTGTDVANGGELVEGNNFVEMTTTANGAWTYTATADCDVTVTVTALSQYQEYFGGWLDGTADIPMIFGMGSLNLFYGDNAPDGSYTITTTVSEGETVTVNMTPGRMPMHVKATLHLSIAEPSESEPETTEPDGTSGNPYPLFSADLTKEIVCVGYHDVYYTYTNDTTEAQTILITYTEGGLVSGLPDDADYGDMCYTVTVAAGETISINPWTMSPVEDAVYTYTISAVTSEGEEGGDVVDEIPVYENVAEIVDDFTLTVGENASVEYVDVTEEHTVVLGTDGYYHLDSADGAIVYVDLDHIFSFQEAIEDPTGTGHVYMYIDGVRTDCTEAIQEYLDAADENGYYPLTEDLILFYQTYGTNAGWYIHGMSYLAEFELIPEDFDPETAWMFACFTVEEAPVEDDKTPETDDEDDKIPATGHDIVGVIASMIVSAMGVVALPVAKKRF